VQPEHLHCDVCHDWNAHHVKHIGRREQHTKPDAVQRAGSECYYDTQGLAPSEYGDRKR